MPREAAATPASACPQARQKRLPGAAGSPHAGHTTAGAPHSTPKRSLAPGPRRAPARHHYAPLNPSAAGQTASADGPSTGHRGHRGGRATLAVHRACSHRGPGDHFGDMALTGHSHRPGKRSPPRRTCPARWPTRVGRSGPPSWPATVAAGPALRQGTELATMRIPSTARAWQSYRTYSAGS